jgi:hypothetical protein
MHLTSKTRRRLHKVKLLLQTLVIESGTNAVPFLLVIESGTSSVIPIMRDLSVETMLSELSSRIVVTVCRESELVRVLVLFYAQESCLVYKQSLFPFAHV